MPLTNTYLFLFADLIGSTEVATELSQTSYAGKYIASLHWAYERAVQFITETEIFPEVRFSHTIDSKRIALIGDEVFSPTILRHDWLKEGSAGGILDVVASAVSFSFLTKLCWLASPYNLGRMSSQQFPRDIAVGIHIGPATQVFDDKPDVLASLHINVTKRIENSARTGDESRIFASDDVCRYFALWTKEYETRNLPLERLPPLIYSTFRKRGERTDVKGVSRRVQLYELVWKPDSMKVFGKILESPSSDESDTESAVRRLGTICLPPEEGRPDSYVQRWFSSVRSLPSIFFDEVWLLLSCYLLSCAFVRHPKLRISQSTQRKYISTCQSLFQRLERNVTEI